MPNPFEITDLVELAPHVDQEKMVDHVARLAAICEPALTLHLDLGKQIPEDDPWHDFSNVPKNAMLRTVVMDVLTDILGFTEEERKPLLLATASCNWDLRMRKRPDDFTKAEVIAAADFLSEARINDTLVRAAGPEFFQKMLPGRRDAPLELRLMVLAADLVEEQDPREGSKIVDVDTHMDFKQTDRPDLGDGYWRVEREFNHRTIREYFPGVEPAQFPHLILARLQQMLAR